MKKQPYAGDREDSDSFGGLFEIIGGILLSFAIIKYLDSLNFSIFNSSLLIAGLGYLVYVLGFFIKRRNREQIIDSIKNILLITGMLLVLAVLILISSFR